MNQLTRGFIIRDAIEDDIAVCLELDHTYESEHVWQMAIQQDSQGWNITFRTERLPRPVEHLYTTTYDRLELALPEDVGFFVIEDKSDNAILGYLTMRYDPFTHEARILDIVITRTYRRMQFATRLLGVAKHWANQHNARQLVIETTTQNFPGILFCQSNGLKFCGYDDRYFSNGDIAIFFGQSLR